MSKEPLTNAAVNWARDALAALSAGRPTAEGLASQAEVDERFAEGFVSEDRRSVFSFGRLEGATDMLRLLEASWFSSESRPQWTMSDVVAVRGERTAAFVVLLDYGDNTEVENITVVHLATDMRVHRHLIFDSDDRDAAIAEVERLHAESGG